MSTVNSISNTASCSLQAYSDDDSCFIGKTQYTQTISCGDAGQEFESLPYIDVLSADDTSNTYYLGYYETLVGNDPLKNRSVQRLVVEPLGKTCYDIITIGGLFNFWRSVRFLNVAQMSNLSISKGCSIRDCNFNGGVMFSGGTLQYSKGAEVSTNQNEKNCCCINCIQAGNVGRTTWDSTGTLAPTTGGFCCNVTAAETFDFGGQRQFLAKDCVLSGTKPAFSGGAWMITLLNCKTEATSTEKQQDDLLATPTSNIISVNDPDSSFQNICPSLSCTVQNNNGINSIVINGVYVQKMALTGNITLISPDDALGSFKDITSILNGDSSVFVLKAGRYKISWALNLVGKHLIGFGFPIVQLQNEITFQDCYVCSVIFDVYGNFDGKSAITFNKNVQSFDLSIRVGGYSDSEDAKVNKRQPQTPISIVNRGCALRVSGNYCYLENIWIWRADHTIPDNPNLLDSNFNAADHGLIVDGKYVVIAGLQVDNFNREHVIWNGDYGKVCSFQSDLFKNADLFETPVFVVNGSRFTGYSFGIYCNFLKKAISVDHAIRITSSASDAQINNYLVKFIGGLDSSGISHALYDENSQQYFGKAASKSDDFSDINLNVLFKKGAAGGTAPDSPISAWKDTSPSPPESSKSGQGWLIILYCALGGILIVLIAIIFWKLFKQ